MYFSFGYLTSANKYKFDKHVETKHDYGRVGTLKTRFSGLIFWVWPLPKAIVKTDQTRSPEHFLGRSCAGGGLLEGFSGLIFWV